MDGLAVAHRWLGFATVWLLLGHGVVTTIGYALGDRSGVVDEFLTLITTYPYVLMATRQRGPLRGRGGQLDARGASSALLRDVVRDPPVRLSGDRARLPPPALRRHGLHRTTRSRSPTGSPCISWRSRSILVFRVGQPVWPLRAPPAARRRTSSAKAPDVVSIYITGRDLDQLAVRSGQYFLWRFLTRDGWWRGHPFSISSAPNGAWLRITIKELGDWSGSLAGRPGRDARLRRGSVRRPDRRPPDAPQGPAHRRRDRHHAAPGAPRGTPCRARRPDPLVPRRRRDRDRLPRRARHARPRPRRDGPLPRRRARGPAARIRSTRPRSTGSCPTSANATSTCAARRRSCSGSNERCGAWGLPARARSMPNASRIDRPRRFLRTLEESRPTVVRRVDRDPSESRITAPHIGGPDDRTEQRRPKFRTRSSSASRSETPIGRTALGARRDRRRRRVPASSSAPLPRWAPRRRHRSDRARARPRPLRRHPARAAAPDAGAAHHGCPIAGRPAWPRRLRPPGGLGLGGFGPVRLPRHHDHRDQRLRPVAQDRRRLDADHHGHQHDDDHQGRRDDHGRRPGGRRPDRASPRSARPTARTP